MKEIRNFYAQPIRLILSLTPCLVFILTATLMTGVSELTNEPEIIFPEAAAIALGAIISPRLPWKVNKLSALILVFICAVAGLTISRYVLLPVEYKLAIAYITGLFFYTFFGTSFAPIISAVVLPVLMNTQSLIYIAAAVSLTSFVLAARIVLERTGLRDREKTEIAPLPDAECMAGFILKSAIVALVCIFAVKTDLNFSSVPRFSLRLPNLRVVGIKRCARP